MFMRFELPEGGVILAQVVRHVPIGVDREQLGAGVNQELDQVQVATGGSRMLKKKLEIIMKTMLLCTVFKSGL